MGKASREKGKRGEREFARELQRIGFADARRGQQHRGGGDSPDVLGVPGIHFEVKRTESLRLWPALAQARAEADTGDAVCVAHRPNAREWVLVIPLYHVITFACAILRGLGWGIDPRPDERACRHCGERGC